MIDPENEARQGDDATKLCKERAECRLRTRTQKGIEMDLEIATKKRTKAGKDLKKRLEDAYELLRLPNDLVKVTASIDGLEMEMNRFRSINDLVLDLLITMGDDGDSKDDGQFTTLWESSLECMADLKTKIKDLEFERSELLSQRSSKRSILSKTSKSSALSATKQAAIEAATLKEKMKSLQRRQHIDRRQDELKRQQKELQRLDEEEELRGELNAAEAIRGLLIEDEISQTKLKETELQDPWDISQLSRYSPRRNASNAINPIKKEVTPPTMTKQSTGNPTMENKESPIYSALTSLHPVTSHSHRSAAGRTTTPLASTDAPFMFTPSVAVSTTHAPSQPLRVTAVSAHPTAAPYASTPQTIPNGQLFSPPYSTLQADCNPSFVESISKIAQLQRLPQAKPDIFRGDDKDKTRFFLWETAFDALVHSAPISPQQKLYLLYQHLDGRAKKVVEQLQFMVDQPEIAYSEARKMLKHRFGHSAILQTDFELKLNNWPKIGSNDPQAMQDYSDFLNQVNVASRYISNLKIFEYPSKIQALIEKLPGWFKTKWSSRVQTLQQTKGYDAFPSFSDFVAEVTFHAERMNIPQLSFNTGTAAASSKPGFTNTTYQRKNFAAALATKIQQSNESQETFCKYHESKTHALADCKKFNELTYLRRKDFFFKNQLCFNCGNTSNHVSKDCEEPTPTCNICQGRHLSTLHKEEDSDDASKSTTACTKVCGSPKKFRSCARIVLVEVTHQLSPCQKTLTYAVLDDQSTDVFVTNSLLGKLGVKGEEVHLQVDTIIGTNTIRTNKLFGLRIQDVDHNHAQIKVPFAYTREDIPASHHDIATPMIAKEWEHLTSIIDKIKYHQDVGIGMLIGRNVPTAFQPLNIIYGKENEPWAEEYKFGWTVIGDVCPRRSSGKRTKSEPVSINRLTVQKEDVKTETPTASLISTKDTTSPQQLREMMELDYNELHYSRQIKGTDKAESMDDQRFRKILEEKIHKNANGNWEAPLPFKTNNVILPNNKQQCLHRLLSLKRKLAKDKNLKKAYVEFIQKLLDRNHASRIPIDQLATQPGKVWHLPHFDVHHPKKPDQVRVVFDCSAVCNNESLNNHLLQGPDLMNALVGVLLRFRKDEVAFTCDVEQMFHSFFVNVEDRDFLRFLWFEGNDLDGRIVEYRMNVHLFGAISSPGVANYCLHETAESGREEFGNKAADFLRKDFYVDDGLMSVPTVEDAVKLIKESQAMCAAKNLRLHKFASNSKEVLQAVSIDDRAKDLKDLDLRHDTLPIQRSLGTYWCIESDTLGFRIELKDKPLTRRGILSTTSSVYDPLGIVAPVILVSKQILQSLCKQNVGWDDPVPDDIAQKWERWRTELPLLEKVKIDRCVKPSGFGTPVKAEIHSFSDASDNGLGQVSYLRLVNARDEVHVSFLMAKSRVAPLKTISIPRMELTASVISVSVANMLKHELDYEDLRCVFYTDSEIVIGYINNCARRFHVYVANRIQYIRDCTEPSQWHHVKGKDNPADEASRAMTAKELLNNGRWIKGPDMLWEAEVLLTSESSCYTELAEDDVEVRTCLEKDNQATPRENDNQAAKSETTTLLSNGTEVKSLQPILKYLDRFSTWHQAKSWIAAIKRGIRKLKERIASKRNNNQDKGTVSELQQAEKLILRDLQREYFSEEVKILAKLEGNVNQFTDRLSARERNLNTKQKSALFRLDPFIDQDGLLRVGGRITTSDAPYETKHPVILPKRSHITELVIRHFHDDVIHHQGRSATLNAVRQSGYWIINGRSVTASLSSKCITCRKERSKPQNQKMADLPEERTTPAPPFTNTGMDVFGPFHIKEGRKTLKRYGLIFTCLSSRAVHLETLNSMDTDSFINALRRFVNRRGKVRVLRSDQGTNFVGGNNELNASKTELNSTKIKDFLSKQGCDLIEVKFNVPHASHMGGVWERMIRSVRSVLSSLLNQLGTQLDDEALRTLMTEAENVINSRPLTISDLSDPSAAEPLTPNHLLTGKTSVILPPPGSFESPDIYCRKRWRRVQYLANQFWSRWQKEYLNLLNNRRKWINPKRNSQVGDIVLLREDDTPRNQWPLGRITKTYPSHDGLVRKVQVLTAKRKTYDRPIHKLVLILTREETLPTDK